ncbi:ATP-binding cassette domain-containing protein [Desulfitobacterium sp. Sab5]|uniref:ATP-binding cassette domain-containing protein n=1 Tax=Desulfitobacterium nosdiversum TaxID=3375356 RepID=UPI003CF6A58C
MSNIIEIQDLNYTYLNGSPYEHQALKNITLSLNRGDCLGIFGSNGSGKSTLAKILNGLLRPTAGKFVICGIDSTTKHLNDHLWRKVGYVFQYPEKQIFKSNVYDEIAYGPRNLGLSESDVKSRVNDALEKVGFIPDLTEHLSPVNFSGGMRRRIAIAGILAINPEVLIMDEPMASLDPIGRKMVYDIIKNRQENKNTTIIISHDLKEIIDLIDRIVILDHGTVIFEGIINDLQANAKILTKYKFELPDYMQVIYALAIKGVKINTSIKSMAEVVSEISQILRNNPCW